MLRHESRHLICFHEGSLCIYGEDVTVVNPTVSVYA